MTKKAYLTIGIVGEELGRLEIELYDDVVPKTVANFVHHIQKNYRDSPFHRIIRNFMVQGGDYIKGDGTGGDSLYGPKFDDENLNHSYKHSQRGVLSMANSGPDTNGSQFFITLKPTPHLDRKHVVFGQVVKGDDVLRAMEKLPTGKNDCPKMPIVILDCGIIEEEKWKLNDLERLNFSQNKDQVSNNRKNETAEESKKSVHDDDDKDEIDLDEEDDDEPDDITNSIKTTTTTSKNPLQDRLRKLKMKMNQARQLNRTEVMEEGRRISNSTKETERVRMKDKKRNKEEWRRQNSKGLRLGSSSLLEPARDSLQKAHKNKETEIRNRYSVHDYYNPEGQHRHYERNVKSVPRNHDEMETGEIYNPIDSFLRVDKDKEKEGTRRLAKEMNRRIVKQKNKVDRLEFEGEDVSYINKRNQRFNQKISRNYDKATAEIRQNLERGTAL